MSFVKIAAVKAIFGRQFGQNSAKEIFPKLGLRELRSSKFLRIEQW
jgi:hypothetical protein